jgi:hypothetical protein
MKWLDGPVLEIERSADGKGLTSSLINFTMGSGIVLMLDVRGRFSPRLNRGNGIVLTLNVESRIVLTLDVGSRTALMLDAGSRMDLTLDVDSVITRLRWLTFISERLGLALVVVIFRYESTISIAQIKLVLIVRVSYCFVYY